MTTDGCATVWYNSSTDTDSRCLKSLMKTAEKVTRCPLPSQYTDWSHCWPQASRTKGNMLIHHFEISIWQHSHSPRFFCRLHDVRYLIKRVPEVVKQNMSQQNGWWSSVCILFALFPLANPSYMETTMPIKTTPGTQSPVIADAGRADSNNCTWGHLSCCIQVRAVNFLFLNFH